MDIMELGAIGELVGGVAVIGSLLFVGVQVRRSAQATRRAVAQGALDASAIFLEHVSASQELSVLLFQGFDDHAGLSPEQQQHFGLLFFSELRRWESIVHQSDTGALDDADWEGLRHTMVEILGRPGLKGFWASYEQNFNTSFREFVRKCQVEGA